MRANQQPGTLIISQSDICLIDLPLKWTWPSQRHTKARERECNGRRIKTGYSLNSFIEALVGAYNWALCAEAGAALCRHYDQNSSSSIFLVG